ncbi:hypothetical protein COF61_10390 [Bacillus toyonensis]|uniref:Uncharacterized protein n=1 Tax=Bacillus cereus VD196 TaxID=1053243 RepID=A0A9W5V887_BACCE|nr:MULTISPECIES: hypothetical protein [Bacillus cereus group]EOO65765.1 hypothetical protein IKE_03349 [Bacillus cereus VD196]PEK52688.1 hypothetical protein CN586_07460 [Bacillus toyonensis]PEM47926.1 hypothetical protein CN636_03735 [Bacillus toyonensis]PHD66008.1 hypothetical protein COF61_10390 [Bacillus toyonensis]
MLVKYDGVKDGKSQMIQITDHASNESTVVSKTVKSLKEEHDFDEIQAYLVEWVENNDSMRFEYEVIKRVL